MCGYFGVYGPREKQYREVPHLSLEHRGPDSAREWHGAGAYFKHYRLAILGGDAGAQPMASKDGRWQMLFNGEIYNYVELATEMGSPDLIPLGDSRVLMEHIERHGVSQLSDLNGMFSIALLDTKNHELYLIRDRFGVKPLYYQRRGEEHFFASEIKALIKSKSSISEKAVTAYLESGHYPSGIETFYRDIYQVQAGCFLKIDRRGAKESRYYDFATHVEELEERLLTQEEYQSLLLDAVKIRLRSNRTVSLHLSAGVDSLALGVLTKKLWDKDYPCQAVSMGFADPMFDEGNEAAERARALGFPHQISTLTSGEVPTLAESLQFFQDEPFGGIPTIAYYKMNKIEQSAGMIVSLEGQGGDEALLGYRAHLCLAAYDRITGNNRDKTLALILSILKMNEKEVVSAAEQLIASNFAAHTDLSGQRDVKSEPAERAPAGWLRSIQLYDILENKIPRTLRFNDRASAATSREIRCPFLDYRVLAYGVALPVEQKVSELGAKAPFRSMIRESLSLNVDAKRSVVTPQSVWFQSDLRGWASEKINQFKARHSEKLFQDRADEAITLLENTKIENSFLIWQLINLELAVEDLSRKIKSHALMPT